MKIVKIIEKLSLINNYLFNFLITFTIAYLLLSMFKIEVIINPLWKFNILILIVYIFTFAINSALIASNNSKNNK
jgi:hypothetical protein